MSLWIRSGRTRKYNDSRCRRGKIILLGDIIHVYQPSSVRRPPNRGGGTTDHGNWGCKPGPQVSIVVWISHRYIALGHIKTGDDDWLGIVTVSSRAGRCNPTRLAMAAFHVFYGCVFLLGVSSVGRVLGLEGDVLFFCVPGRGPDTGFRRPGGRV